MLTARARLTVLFTVLFAIGGSIVIVATYLLVAQNLSLGSIRTPATDPTFIEDCARMNPSTAETDPTLKAKCASTLANGVSAAARVQRQGILDNLLLTSTLVLLAVTIVITFLGWYLAGRILQPIHQMTEAARASSAGNLRVRLGMTGPQDELRELADTFDALLDRLEAAFARQQQFIANASHELRTPLTVMRTTLDVVLAKKAPTTDELAAMGNEVRVAVEQADSLIETLLALARNESGTLVREPLDLSGIADKVISTASWGNLRPTRSLQPAPAAGDPVLIERLVANLIDNAIRYNKPDGTVQITTLSQDRMAVLHVTNTGPLIGSDQLDDLFNPFTRIHQRVGSGGHGLGLTLVKSIATTHGGNVTAVACPDGGMAISVELPARQPAIDGSR
ncbi:hypothetical protein AL755_09415 [Arthrobacter sp. ERGS1:01]|nr:hypothetical protein AL755_09415 [Arthrobacter sp. ERGS1:01]